MAEPYTIEVFKGLSFSAYIAVTDNDDEAIDLTDYNVTGEVRTKYSEEPIEEFTIDIGSPPSAGVILVSLTREQTDTFPVDQLLFTITGISSGNDIRVLSGYINVYP